MHLLVLDSFTPRGMKSICEIPPARRTIHEEDRRDDVFAAIQWLARQPGVDKNRIAIVGRSHGAQTVLSVLDDSVRPQAAQIKAAIALYPGCTKFTRMPNYSPGAPLLLMAGANDNWTPAKNCVELHEKVMRSQKNAVFELRVFPDSYHSFDSMEPVHTKTNVGGTKSGSATVGGNPAAREESHRLMFDFLSKQFGEPLLMTHEERLKGHPLAIPATQ